MSDWSVEKMYVGKLGAKNFYVSYWVELMNMFKFDDYPDDSRACWWVADIGRCGPTLYIEGEGRYGVPMPLVAESWEALKKNVAIWFYSDAYGEGHTLTIFIGGEEVFKHTGVTEDQFEKDENGELLETPDGCYVEKENFEPWPRYMGRNEVEKKFFEEFWNSYYSKEEVL